uniref:Uncharacterized protein n=1 Tax=Anopheles epiroticus TaxID=199890 RepID=A0A182P7W5_9DIPT
MTYRLLVSCLLVLVLAETSAAGGSFLTPDASVYCPFALDILDSKNAVVPADRAATCKKRWQEDDDKIKQAIGVIDVHLKKQAAATDPIWAEVRKLTYNVTQMVNSPQLNDERGEVEQLRMGVLVAAIEAGRIPEAMTQFLMLNGWNRWPDIVGRIYQNTRRHRMHIENVLSFIRAVPARDDRIAFYHELKRHMVEKKDYESYLGAMFASDARHVVFAEDGKTPVNESDVKALYDTMRNGAANYFRRALLTGTNRYDLILLDRDHPELFDLLFQVMMDVPKEEMRKFSSWTTMEALCLMTRPMAKANMFQKVALLLLEHFKWEKENEYYAPMLAGYFEVCLPEITKDPATKNLVTEVKNIFSRFKQRKDYKSIAAIIGKNVHAYAG